MYLSLLNTEQKHWFLDLELYIAKTDGEFSLNEKQVIDAHCLEMRIDNNNYESELPLEVVLNNIVNSSTNKEKNIIFFEITATVLADEKYQETEQDFIKKLSSYLKISDKQVSEAFDIVKCLKRDYKRCSDFVEEDV